MNERARFRSLPEILAKYVGTYEEQPPLLESRCRASSRSPSRTASSSPTWTAEARFR